MRLPGFYWVRHDHSNGGQWVIAKWTEYENWYLHHSSESWYDEEFAEIGEMVTHGE